MADFGDVGKVIGGILSLLIYLTLIPVLTNILQSALSSISVSDPTMSSLISAIVGLLPTIMIFTGVVSEEKYFFSACLSPNINNKYK